ncbi:glycosyltransferase family 9 protein [Vibrio algarum]|uniref:Glycosyltransferase family 9 protein n=1 Tax=Vibrio algarum TaxID=3020714 RepID=A0ABT4YLP1_9VIBR|nr:glycosyltransferase family 9 protein [Vibrio sp. KJ40-1]MDB1122449.1 glycosyltransferase family 9 protein [Vibrio sp. KJ40-1]
MSSSSINTLKLFDPQCKISVVTTPAMSELFKTHFGADTIYQVPKRPKYWQLKKLAEELGEVDLIISLNDNMKMKDMYFLNKVNANHIAGLDDTLKLVDIKLGEKTKNLHFSDKFSAALESVGIPASSTQYIIPVLGESKDKATQFLNSNSIQNDFLVLNPFGSGHSRKLNHDSVHKLVTLINESTPELPIILLSAPDTEADAEKMCQTLPENVTHFNISETIFDVIALIEQASYVISVDTAIVHIASGLNKPQLGIYNPDPKNFAQWGPNSDKAITIFTNKCSPPSVNDINWSTMKEKIEQLV